ncbi:valine--tRNA ligase [Paramaledivibacter caminithermalis]|uniref:Valine--tRNA ligase n=1 Tax=Paramaledivibacter caminithermalis (strain DSM 15212 / CIP 107654 / DViRD3) TaxID=1121301 RepID=A0A1M6LD18_PARC5|nr:valine--tRNA ligase [Paramaledivibacter caminithermalis]SHJ69089.1 valyl-tRNA synthetase [Paramaledivibacter caminithermalis DSM 15212]
MTKENLATKYNPKEFEEKIYSMWMENNLFKPELDPEKETYTIVLPPPNITGQLHMGHALDQTLQDILIRWKRMQGYAALWLPGTDHASIATEVKVVEKIYNEEGKTKEEIGREEFLKRAWKWKEEYGNRIVEQMKKLGNSCDWSRERFTMDEGCNKAVTEVFIKLYEKGYIYRGNRLINWCPDCKTSLSDAEVEHEEKQGFFWHIKYPVKDSDEYVEIATTRPETMLGDTAVAVHPEDDRYKHLIGKTLILPIVNREIPVIADEYVEMDFGTGAVKITPAHDPNDFEVGIRHNLPQIIVMNEDATMNENAGKYEGMDRYECRKALVKDLKEQGYLVKTKEHNHNVGACYRCNTVVEPMLSDQWFVKMEELAKPAIEAVKKGDLKFVPDRFSKIYLHWLENIKDWCISRQLWWGHRIPAYYCHDCGEIIVSKDKPENCTKCDSTKLSQDEDVLDTWFSSALWPFSTLGWPEETEDLKYFYPTNVLVTGYDIIFFWVVRMVFSALDQIGKVPFKHVFVHGLVRDSQGRKMSKSLGNGVDPLEVIDMYGADALRFMLATGNSPGNDMRFYMERVENCRNFANKLWNASRFVLMNLNKEELNKEYERKLTLSDRWILSRLNTVADEITKNLEKFELGIAAQKIYDFIWNEYCDWYIELVKPRLYGEDFNSKRTAQDVLLEVLEGFLKLLHPFMPFITEEIWGHLPNSRDYIITSEWTRAEKEKIKPDEEKKMELIMEAIKNIRNIRAEMNVAPSKKAKVIVVANDNAFKTIEENKSYLITLASASEVIIQDNKSNIPEDSISTVIDGAEIFIPLDDLVDFEKELDRLQKEKDKLEKELDRVNKKLSNEGFISKAPAKLVEEEKEKKEKYQEMYNKVLERLEYTQNKLK